MLTPIRADTEAVIAEARRHRRRRWRTNATLEPDPTGRYFLITGLGPSEKIPGQVPLGADGEIFLWTVGTRQPVPILHDFILAIWAGVDRP